MGMIVEVPIPKAGAGVTFKIDVDILASNDFPLPVYLEICLQGCKTLLNRGQSKLKSSKGLEGKAKEDAVKAILEIVQKQYDAMLAGETRITGGKAKLKGVEREVKAEAMRLARLAVRDAIKASGGKISHYSAKKITEAAEEVLADEERGPQFMEIAKANVAKRHELDEPAATTDEAKAKGSALIDALGLKADPKLVAKAEKSAAEKKAKKGEKVPAGVMATAKPQGQQSHAKH
jgi:hypothetical protein